MRFEKLYNRREHNGFSNLIDNHNRGKLQSTRSMFNVFPMHSHTYFTLCCCCHFHLVCLFRYLLQHSIMDRHLSSRTQQNWITPNRTWNELFAPEEKRFIIFIIPFSRQMRLMPNSTVFYFAYYEQVFTLRGIPTEKSTMDSKFFIHFPQFWHAPHAAYMRAPLHELFYYWIS